MTDKAIVTERLRMFRMPCCGHLLCWLGTRDPGFCPECGVEVLRAIRTEKHTLIQADATLTYDK